MLNIVFPDVLSHLPDEILPLLHRMAGSDDMKPIIPTLIISLAAYGCESIQSPKYSSENGGEIRTEFKLTNTWGAIKTTFRSGENFFMDYTLTNETGKTQHYTIAPPFTVFEIWSGDSLISTSIDGFAFAMSAPIRTKLEHSQSLSYFWLAPNTIATPGRITLRPGNYEAKVQFTGRFDRFGILPKEHAPFSVVE